MFIPKESLLGRMGGQVGTGLASGLQYAGQQQLQQQRQAQLADTLRALNIPEEASQLPEPVLGAYIKQRMLNEARGLQYGEPTVQEIAGQAGQPIHPAPQRQLGEMASSQAQFQQQYPQESQQRAVPAGVNPRAVPRNVVGKAGAAKLTPEQQQDLGKYQNYLEQEKVLRDMYKIWKGGKVPAGRFGRSLEFLTGPSSVGQDFDALANKLVELRIDVLGNPTNAKLDFLRKGKPNLEMNAEVQGSTIKRGLRDAQVGAKEAFARLPSWQQEELRRVGQAPVQEEAEQRREVSQERQPEQQKQLQRAEDPEDKPPQESWIDWIGRNLSRARQKTAEALAPSKEFQEWADSYLPSPVREGKKQFEELMKQEPQEEPRNFAEETFDNVLSSLPLFYAGGPAKTVGQIAKTLLRDVGSIGAATAVKRQGGGAIPQIVASMLPGVAANTVKSALGRGASPAKLKDAARLLQKKSYDTEAKLGSKITVPVYTYPRKLAELEAKIGRDSIGLDSTEKNELLNKITELRSDIVGGKKLNAARLAERDKAIYKSWGDRSPAGKEYLTQASDIIKGEIDRIGKRHPAWHNALMTGKDITKALNWKETIARKLDINPKIASAVGSKVAASILGLAGTALGYAAKGLPGVAAGTGLVLGANKLGTVAAFAMSSNPKVKKLAQDAMQKIVSGSGEAAARAVAQLSKATEKYDGLVDEQIEP